jgi:integrase
MASIRERKRRDGTVTYAVLWRNVDDGKQTSMQWDSQEEADRFKRIVEANGNSLSAAHEMMKKVSVGGLTLREALIRHIGMLTSAGPDQIHRYERAVINHFGGDFGKLPVASVEYSDVVAWVKRMQGKGLSAKTIANHHGFLSAAMSTAVRLKLREGNPCDGITLPKDDATEEKMRFMSAKESVDVVNAHPERYRAFVEFLRATGGRFGEATALRSGDFKLDDAVPSVRIERAWKRGGDGAFYVGAPKTKKSRRSVSLPPSTVAVVRPLVEAAAAKGREAYVFTTSYGGPIRHSTFHEFWTTALDSLGYEKTSRPRIHDLRHTHASLMLAAGMPIYDLSRRLGHESIQTTIDRYSHLVPDAQWRGANIAEKALTA